MLLCCCVLCLHLLSPIFPSPPPCSSPSPPPNRNKVIGDYYRSLRVPLLSTELQAIKTSFANPATRRMELAKLEAYIFLHPEPCRKHGRTVCGSCFYTGKCRKPGCGCAAYRKSGGSGSVCRDCYHPPDMHARCPLQMREAALGVSMLATMNRARDPDLSAPASVRGISLADVVVPPPDRDARMMKRIVRADAAGRSELQLASTSRMSTLTKRLSYLETAGEEAAAGREYWGQRQTDVLHALGDSGGQPTATTDVASCAVPPSVGSITPAQFWAAASKNPNKSLRDYDEAFGHRCDCRRRRGVCVSVLGVAGAWLLLCCPPSPLSPLPSPLLLLSSPLYSRLLLSHALTTPSNQNTYAQP